MEGVGPVHIVLTWHGMGRPRPGVGDWMEPQGPRSRSVYEIVGCRKVNTRDGAKRYRLECLKYPKAHGIPDGARVIEFWWNRRTKRRR